MIENIRTHCKTHDSLACAYFFFDGRDSQRNLQSYNSLIRSLLCQLSSKCSPVPTVLTELYKECNNGCQEPSIEALESALLTITGRFSHVYIIIDALDECTERPKVLKWLETISRLKAGRLHVAVMSRQERDIEDRMKELQTQSISVAEDPANSDIDFYLDRALSTDEHLSRWDEETQNFMKSSLKNGSQGMHVSFSVDLVIGH